MSSGLPSPSFHLFYRGVDISGDLDPETTSVTYTDHLHGKADEMDLTVHDKNGLWKGPWRPEHGDTMTLIINDGQGGILPAGTFEMDEPNATGGRDGDLMTVRGLAAPVSKALRTKVTKAYERQETKDIVGAVAGEIGLEVQGKINALFHNRVTQRRERYLEFIKRLAEETGHYCNLRGNALIFTNFASIDGLPPASLIYHGDRKLIDYDFRFQSHETYSSGKTSYLDERNAKNNEYEEDDPRVTTGDTLRITGERLESAAHAEARLKSELHYANRNRFAGSITCVGSVALAAGNTVELVGFGGYSGKRVIDSSSHTLERGGYTTVAELVDARA